MKKTSMATYMPVLTKVIETTEKMGEQMNPSFEKIRKAIDDGTVDKMVPAEFNDIQMEFTDGTEQYQQNLANLKKVQAPARLIGKHRNLVAAYEKYVEACAAMTASLNIETTTVDVDAFNQAEKDQETSMDHVSNDVQRIMAMVM
ncbi:hypothetical protein [Lactiplantibacillus mudanjiangensis]|uniref:Uncharacterized protein n=1 Tax=Lactiplantibacillus mudanjiangensis TaxID=1296538 RepID=A0A660DYM5_9LACO|nr:hypothetical protein [Lactiplantibacillus mudanjiangensis]VDG18067.1 hypothetical protein [Lactobacillus sp. CBA3605] [Lactiplantibacillus mudanjiangensis]VDG24763.1 hypothetical protein [Lactobacillus sp. CBA3605] [Lactiplantibacillus mudanjiangensis]VDG28488.1 hypothetical protein [Lactobacillus sp. CBA3605] [Lactiplantibacillus mudanjiangensis]VDG31358.1 hypothetical protein [Lactobacillus sp. CBA3605] [Lactiplantibacillus mudanjiangensis]